MEGICVAWFVSPHGFGHAARAAAVMEALSGLETGVRHEIFTTVPAWFFGGVPGTSITCHTVETDVGMVQETPFREDLRATVERLRAFYPLDRAVVSDLARVVEKRRCDLVVCDISPLGVAVARECGRPSVLVENFTWDLIYRGYASVNREFEDFAALIEGILDGADYRVQAEPAFRREGVDLTVSPVGRRRRKSSDETRRALGIAGGEKMALLTAGGIPVDFSSLADMVRSGGCHLVVPCDRPVVERHGGVTLLPYRSEFYHPDLVHASDAVVGKAGYSTVAEVYLAGVPFGYVARRGFRESAMLCAFIREKMPGMEIGEEDFMSAGFLSRLPALLEQPRAARSDVHGAEEAAKFLAEKVADMRP